MKRFFSTTSWRNYIKKTNDHLHLRPWREPPFFIEVVEETKDPSLAFYKWKYQPLPTQTVLDKVNPQFNVRSPEFKLTKTQSGLSRKQWRRHMADIQQAKRNPELEKLSRSRKLFVDIDRVQTEWRKSYGMADLSKLSRFYGINRDMFDNNDIIWKTWLHIAYDDVIVKRGNLIHPKNLSSQPHGIMFVGDQNKLYTLSMTNLDGHPRENNKEIMHWLICNIRNCDISKGEEIFRYVPPMPWKGTGFHRLVFTLYEQSKELTTWLPQNESSITGRTFHSCSFSNEKEMTPVGVAWSQVEWDESVTQSANQMQDLLGEPIFDWEEYIEPKVEDQLLKRQLSELKYRNM